MSNQEPQDQDKTKVEADVEKRRRFIKGAGIAAPVVFSLANRSAFGAARQCLSQQISGNISHVGKGSCNAGKNPDAWKGPNLPVGTAITKLKLVSSITPNGQVATYVVLTNLSTTVRYQIRATTTIKTNKYEWAGTAFKYGTLTQKTIVYRVSRIGNTGPAVPPGGVKVTSIISPNPPPTNGPVSVGSIYKNNETKGEYAGGQIPGTIPPKPTSWTGFILPAPLCYDFTEGDTYKFAFGYGPDRPMREILCLNTSSEASYCVAAMLNASYKPSIVYVMNQGQVREVCANPPTITIPGGDLKIFLASTMEP